MRKTGSLPAYFQSTLDSAETAVFSPPLCNRPDRPVCDSSPQWSYSAFF